MLVDAGRNALAATGIRVALGGAQILIDVSVRVRYGRVTAIAGPNGAGKSTLLRALLGLLPTGSGKVLCDGLPIDQLSHVERAKRAAYVPQRSVLDAALTVADIVAQGRFAHREGRTARNSAVVKALRQAGLRDLAHRDYLSLSGGEQRLTMIARALCTGAKIVCLDEPTACLDIANRLRILALLTQLAAQGHAVVCVLHELEDVRRFANDIVLLQDGRVMATGTPEEIIEPTLIRRVYQVELRENDAVGFRLGDEAML